MKKLFNQFLVFSLTVICILPGLSTAEPDQNKTHPLFSNLTHSPSYDTDHFTVDGKPKTNASIEMSIDKGVLVVTYQTNQEGQRLDRIRFWLVNEKQEKILYPKQDEFVAYHHTKQERTVVISNLTAGKYRIEFVLPNADHFFEEVQPREVNVLEKSVAKIDQAISLKKAKKNFDIAETDNSLLDTLYINHSTPLLPPHLLENQQILVLFPVNSYD